YRQAIALDPLSVGIYSSMGRALFSAGKLKEAEEAQKKVLQLSPNQGLAHNYLGCNYLLQSRGEEALLEMKQHPYPTFQLYGCALSHEALGKKDEAEAEVAELIRQFGNIGAFQIAQIYGYWRQPDEAFEWLERAYRQRDSGLIFIKGSLGFQNLRHDGRW